MPIRLKGAVLVECANCGARGNQIEWEPGFGWVCPTCNSGIHGPNQKPAICATMRAEETQLDLFE